MSTSAGLLLVVDDDRNMRTAVRDLLKGEGYLVIEAADGAAALEMVTVHDPDLILLDLGLPDIGGLDVLRAINARAATPVIVVSGRAGETDRVVGLEQGADDYIVKPFSSRELIARVNAALRSTRRHQPPAIGDFGELVINSSTRDVTVVGTSVALTAREFDLLEFLARSPRHVFSREQLLQHVWESSSTWQDANTVGEHIHRLRRKLDPEHRTRWIETVRGVGYRFLPDSRASD